MKEKGRVVLLSICFLFLIIGSVGMFSSVASAQVRPAATKNVDERGRVPYQFFTQATRGSGACGTNFCDIVMPAVPANKRLVVTNFSATLSLDATAVVQHLRMYVYSASYTILSQFTVPYNPASYPADAISMNNPRRYVVNQELLWFVEAGQTPWIDFHTTGGSLDTDWPNTFLVTGYLVDLSY